MITLLDSLLESLVSSLMSVFGVFNNFADLVDLATLTVVAVSSTLLQVIIRISWTTVEKIYAGLMGKTVQMMTKLSKKKSNLDVSKSDHLIMRLLKKKSSGNSITYSSLLIAFIGEYGVYMQTQEISVLWTMRFTVLMLLFSVINQCVLKYRAEHGLYGTCYSEAKEIISFILELSRENSDSNGGMPKLVFTQEELDQCLQANGGEEYAA